MERVIIPHSNTRSNVITQNCNIMFERLHRQMKITFESLDNTAPESNGSSLITMNNIATAHDQRFPADIEMEEQVVYTKPPPGYIFRPTDEELIVYFLKNKLCNQPVPIDDIVEVNNLYAYNPDFLAAKYKDYGEDHLYIFTPRDRKNKYGYRIHRAAGNGYCKVIGGDKKIKSNETVVGYRTPLLFYKGKAPKGDQTDWIMYEFRVEDSPCSKGMRLDDWVLCKICHEPVKSTKPKTEDDDFATVGSTSTEDDYDVGDDEHIDQINCGNLEGLAIADLDDFVGFIRNSLLNPPILKYLDAILSTTTNPDHYSLPADLNFCNYSYSDPEPKYLVHLPGDEPAGMK
ncbi:hypothetical protein I3842_04G128200 [Carya illinoinensis]|uniref:NAC domain-containing protein n=1 Tax=Carya illinoinensis TaxID=32201 RepID=A0A922F8B2_CARIL|nr:hypothetical protein I3842_04G128200 [Carya illinoinensis]